MTSKAAPRDEGNTDDAFLTKMKAALPRLTVLNGQLTFPSPLYASLLDGLIVLDDVANTVQSPFDWSPIPLDRQKGGRRAGQLAVAAVEDDGRCRRNGFSHAIRKRFERSCRQGAGSIPGVLRDDGHWSTNGCAEPLADGRAEQPRAGPSVRSGAAVLDRRRGLAVRRAVGSRVAARRCQ